MKIYLFRHGQTYFSKHEVPYGVNELTAEILPEAHVPTLKIADFLLTKSVEYAARSELLRCAQTAVIIEEKAQIHFEPDKLLNEFTEKDFTAFHERMKVLVDKIQALEAYSVALCTHGANIAALKKLLAGQPFHAHDLMYYPKTGVIVEVTSEGMKEFDFNE